MRLVILGPLEVHSDDGAVRVRPGHTHRVLCVLLSRANQYVSVAELVNAQWPDNPPASAGQNTRRAIHWLRNAFGDPNRIVHGQAGYTIRLDPEELDAHEFAHLLYRAEQAQRGNQLGEAADLFDRALTLWRGNPYAGLEDCQVLSPEIERLTNLRTQTQEGRAEVYLALGRHTKLIPELAGLVESDPRHERLVGLYMRALYAAGRQADAQEIFWRTKNRLAEELGADPTPELQQLYEAILHGKLDTPTAQPESPEAATKPAGSVVPAQLPADVYGFVGRAPELDRLDTLLGASDEHPTAVVISAVSGTAGVGKTTLAIHWSHRVTDRFPDGQLYVNLRGFDPSAIVVEPTEAIRVFLDAFEVPPQRIPVELTAQTALYRSLLAGRRVLVLLDNARDADQVRPLLPGSPGCLALVTSRNDLTGLVVKEGARPLTLDLLSAIEARCLLEQRIGAGRVAAEPDAVDDILTACAGLPLALAIVAARAVAQPRIPLRSLADKLRQLRHTLDNFAVAADPSAEVRTVFSWSYKQLTPEAQRLFRLLGLHPGPDISAAAAASLTGLPPADVAPPLAELTHAHLVTQHTPVRHGFHDLLRTYAFELTQTHDSAEARHNATNRMLDHYLRTAYAGERLLAPARTPISLAPPAAGCAPETPADREHAMGWFAAEYTVLLAVLDQAVAGGFDVHASQLPWTLDTYIHRRGRGYDRFAISRTALEATQRLGDQRGEARARRFLANACHSLGRLEAAQAHLHRSLQLSAKIGDTAGEAHAHFLLAVAFDGRGHPAEALNSSSRALELYCSEGDRVGQAIALNAIGWHQTQLGEHEQALSHCKQALALHQELGNREGEAATWDSLGHIHHRLGLYQEAVDCYQLALDQYRNLSGRFGEARTLNHLGDIHRADGDTDAARQCWQQAQAILEDLNDHDAEQVKAKLEDLDQAKSRP